MKKIFRYIILLIVRYILVGAFTYIITKQYYRNFSNYEILTENPQIEIIECKTSYAKGYIKGTVTNTTGEIIDESNVQLTIYNKNGEFLGCEYYTIQYFHPQENASFEINFSYKNVGNIEVRVINEKLETIKGGLLNSIDDEMLGYGIITFLLFKPI